MRRLKTVLLASIIALVVGLIPAEGFAASATELYCKDPNYTCVTVKRGQTWQSMFPNKEQRDIVMRINRTNLQPWAGKKIVIPKNLAHLTALDVAPFPKTIPAPGQKTIIVRPVILAWGAYDADGNLVHWGPMSGGKSWCSDIGKSCHTAIGEFLIYDKRGKGCKSSKFPVGRGGAPMPYCMFFHGGFALHASASVPGYNASHGCVRITLEDAAWLNQYFIDMPSENSEPTKVIVKPYDQPVSDKI